MCYKSGTNETEYNRNFITFDNNYIDIDGNKKCQHQTYTFNGQAGEESVDNNTRNIRQFRRNKTVDDLKLGTHAMQQNVEIMTAAKSSDNVTAVPKRLTLFKW